MKHDRDIRHGVFYDVWKADLSALLRKKLATVAPTDILSLIHISPADLQRAVETALRRAQADKDARYRSAYIDRD